MDSVRSQEAATVHGEVEYETVTCSSCETEIPKQSAQQFVIGDVVGYDTWSYRGVEEYEFDQETCSTGWACEYCRTEGPIDFPQSLLQDPDTALWVTAFAFAFGALVGMVMVI